MNLYIIGKISGVADNNRPAFEEARLKLNSAGFHATIPHQFVPEAVDYPEALRLSAKQLLCADGVARLPDWYLSHGAVFEDSIARECGIPAHSVEKWLEIGADNANS